MISYEPFLKYLEENDIQVTSLSKAKIISTATVAKLNKNEATALDTIEKLCKEFMLPIEKVVCILDDKGNAFNGGVYVPDNSLPIKVTKSNRRPQLQTVQERIRRKKYLIENLKNLRKEKKYTQDQLAEFIGVTKQMISLWDTKKHYVYEEYLEKLIELLNIPEENIKEVE